VNDLFPFEFAEFTDSKNNPLLEEFVQERELPLVYGYTVDFKERKVTSLLMVSSIPTCNLKRGVEEFKRYLEEAEVTVAPRGRPIKVWKLWKKRLKLAEVLKTSLYAVLWNEERVALVDLTHKRVKPLTWPEFASFIGKKKSIKAQNKPLMYASTPPFEKRLRSLGVTGPGDLDGFTFEGERPVFYEFSTRNADCETLERHDPNRFMHQDYRRWGAPMILKEQAGGKLNLVIWSPCCWKKLIIWKEVELQDRTLTKREVEVYGRNR